jgi:hypothetical protein
LDGYGSAQQQVSGIDPKSIESVRASLKAVSGAMDSCRAADRSGEVAELTKAKNELAAQVGLLEKRAQRQARRAPTAEELKNFEKEGDPSCPRGQAYRPPGAKEVRCTGPQLVDMSAQDVQRYFQDRDYRVRSPSAATVDVERGSERYTFSYAPGATGASCVLAFPPPDMPWQEAMARLTGVNPSTLKRTSGVVHAARATLPYTVNADGARLTIGACGPGG